MKKTNRILFFCIFMLNCMVAVDALFFYRQQKNEEPALREGGSERNGTVFNSMKIKFKDMMRDVLHISNEDNEVNMFGINIIKNTINNGPGQEPDDEEPNNNPKSLANGKQKYPLRDFGGAAYYDNENDIRTTWEKTFQYTPYSDFKRLSDFLTLLKNMKEENEAIINIKSRIDDILNNSKRKPIIKRRHFNQNRGIILGAPRRPQDLPRAEYILPGHTLLRPSSGMLKSAVKYPLRDVGGAAVYGNEDNVGITWGKTRQRIRYSNFRKANNLMNAIKNVAQKNKEIKESNHPMIVVELNPSDVKYFVKTWGVKKPTEQQKLENEIFGNQLLGNEIMDDLDGLEEDSSEVMNLRRKSKKTKYRDRSVQYATRSKKSKEESSSASSDSSSDDELEKNPGNPYTIYKNKYKQNWMWNHKMDGVHMNINPYAPQLNSLGPSGPELFFGRKWWYFNQDDYKPMRRR